MQRIFSHTRTNLGEPRSAGVRRGGSRVTASDSECSDCFLGALGAPRGRGDPWGALYGRARGRFRS
eukprot:1587344-Prymnesium_polylepis.1